MTSAVVDIKRPQQTSSRGLNTFLSLLWTNKLMLLGALLTALFAILGIVGIVISHVGNMSDLYLAQKLSDALKPPLTDGHVLGTDHFGRDLFWRMVAGTGVSLLIGVAITLVSMVIGMAMGTIAGYYGGMVDQLIGGLIDLTWGFPVILVAVIFVGILGPGFATIVLAVSVVNWAGFARIIRAQSMSLRKREFVEAAQALGISDYKIILRHIVPHTTSTTLVMASYYIAVSVIVEAGLSFIGLGIQPPTPSLGQMVSDGRNYLSISLWSALIPGFAITLIVLGLNTLGDGLRDFADPRLTR